MDQEQQINYLIAFADLLVKGNHEFPASDAETKFVKVTDELTKLLVPSEIKEKKKMTNGCFEVTTSNPNIVGIIMWTKETTNIVDNTSNILISMYLHRTKSGYSSYGEDMFWVNINGNEIADTKSYLIDNIDVEMVSGIIPVKTNEITISWGGGGGPKGLFKVNPGSETVVLT